VGFQRVREKRNKFAQVPGSGGGGGIPPKQHPNKTVKKGGGLFGRAGLRNLQKGKKIPRNTGNGVLSVFCRRTARERSVTETRSPKTIQFTPQQEEDATPRLQRVLMGVGGGGEKRIRRSEKKRNVQLGGG